MKKTKVSLLALSVLAGGSLGTLAAAPIAGTDYFVEATFTNPAPTSIFYVDSIPLPDTNANLSVQILGGSISTDGSGKIDGAATLRFQFISGTNVTAIADIVCDISGNIILKNGTTPTPQATIQLKGNGASVDSAGNIGVANCSLKLVGTPTNNTIVGITKMTGAFSGTVKTGLKSVNSGKPNKLNTTGSVFCAAESLYYEGQIVQSGTKLYTQGTVGVSLPSSGMLGNGSINTKKSTYTMNLQGFGFAKSASLNLNGTTAAQTNIWVTFGTNPPTQTTVMIPATADAKGKIAGQSVNAKGGSVSRILF